MSDAQFGMFTKNASFDHETVNLEFAIASANRLKPAFVVITGDLINDPASVVQGSLVRIQSPRSSGTRLPAARSTFVATKPHTIDEYLAGLSPENRAALQKVRRAVHAAAPGAEECISYGMPAFRLNGKLIAGFKAAANHCSFHPMSGDTVATLVADLGGYDTSRGTIRFPARAGLPATLVRKLVKTRIAEG